LPSNLILLINTWQKWCFVCWYWFWFTYADESLSVSVKSLCVFVFVCVLNTCYFLLLSLFLSRLHCHFEWCMPWFRERWQHEALTCFFSAFLVFSRFWLSAFVFSRWSVTKVSSMSLIHILTFVLQKFS
jgi:hypothetical protein